MGKIASSIGKPMMINECTTKNLRISYGRVLVEVDVTTELKTSITIRDPKGRRLEQAVEYEWTPSYCKKSNKVGHECKDKRKQQNEPQVTTKQVWITKSRETNIEELEQQCIVKAGARKQRTEE